VFFCVSVGVAPGWLYGLLPAEPAFPPYEIGRTAPQLELLGAAGVAYIALRAFKLAPREGALRLLDVDALYRGPAAGTGRWVGVVLLRLYGSWNAAWERLGARTARAIDHLTRSCDRPYRVGASTFFHFLMLALAIAVALVWQTI
jgi:multicomponent Na+:H+ antiporter subunit D